MGKKKKDKTAVEKAQEDVDALKKKLAEEAERNRLHALLTRLRHRFAEATKGRALTDYWGAPHRPEHTWPTCVRVPAQLLPYFSTEHQFRTIEEAENGDGEAAIVAAMERLLVVSDLPPAFRVNVRHLPTPRGDHTLRLQWQLWAADYDSCPRREGEAFAGKCTQIKLKGTACAKDCECWNTI